MRPTIFFLASLLVAAGPALATDARLVITNDPVAGNERPDDLYTADFELEVALPRRATLFAGERMFTDRERRFRFDETHVELAVPLRNTGQWNTTVRGGLLRAGRGILGQETQNTVHRLIGNTSVRLPYVTRDETFGVLAIETGRSLGRFAGLELTTTGEAYTAPGFRSWVRSELQARRPLGRSTNLTIGTGARADLVESDLLGDHIASSAATASVALEMGSFQLRWAWNEYGTRSSHVSVAFRPSYDSGRASFGVAVPGSGSFRPASGPGPGAPEAMSAVPARPAGIDLPFRPGSEDRRP